MIDSLPLLTPNLDRAERTLARCHQRLARARKRREALNSAHARYLVVERALVGGFCVIYLSGIALFAIRMLAGL